MSDQDQSHAMVKPSGKSLGRDSGSTPAPAIRETPPRTGNANAVSRLRVELWADGTLVADSEDRDLWAKVFTVVAAQSGSGGGDRAELTASTAQADQPKSEEG